MEIKRTDIEDVILVDDVWVELAYEGDAVNVGGVWINTDPYNPDDLNEVRRIISSNEEIMSLLNNARAQREFSRAQARKVTLVDSKVTWYNEKDMPPDSVIIKLAADGNEVSIADLWVGTAKFNPDDLNDVHRIITSDLNVQLRLTQIRDRTRVTK